MESKSEIRKRMLEIRSEISSPEYELRSLLISEHIESFLESYPFQTIHSYLPFRNEVDVLPLLKTFYRRNKRIVTSIIKDNRMLDHVEFNPNDTFAKGKFGVPIPMLQKPFNGEIDVILVPGVAFDHEGNRIGYGAGYYDRFLENYPNATKIGVCFLEQIDIELPSEIFDHQMDIVISD